MQNGNWDTVRPPDQGNGLPVGKLISLLLFAGVRVTILLPYPTHRPLPKTPPPKFQKSTPVQFPTTD
ncbi:MAG: hypothetical protein ABGY75_20855 [Gemmataceae bacterium]